MARKPNPVTCVTIVTALGSRLMTHSQITFQPCGTVIDATQVRPRGALAAFKRDSAYTSARIVTRDFYTGDVTVSTVPARYGR